MTGKIIDVEMSIRWRLKNPYILERCFCPNIIQLWPKQKIKYMERQNNSQFPYDAEQLLSSDLPDWCRMRSRHRSLLQGTCFYLLMLTGGNPFVSCVHPYDSVAIFYVSCGYSICYFVNFNIIFISLTLCT